MNKTLLTILTALMLLFGTVGVVAAAGDKAAIDQPNTLQTTSQQIAPLQLVAQTQDKIQSTDQLQDQVQLRLDTVAQTGTCSGTHEQDRIRLETKNMLQDQTRLRDQNQDQLSQPETSPGTQNRLETRWQNGKP